VLNNGTPSISGFNLVDRKLTALAGPARPLSGADADPAQGFVHCRRRGADRDRARDEQHQQ